MGQPVFPKFLIIDDKLLIAKVTYHKEMVTNKENVIKGGGWFKFNADKGIFTLYGQSEDFGPAKLEDIKSCVDANEVYNGRLRDHHKLSSNFTILYEDEYTGEITTLNKGCND